MAKGSIVDITAASNYQYNGLRNFEPSILDAQHSGDYRLNFMSIGRKLKTAPEYMSCRKQHLKQRGRTQVAWSVITTPLMATKTATHANQNNLIIKSQSSTCMPSLTPLQQQQDMHMTCDEINDNMAVLNDRLHGNDAVLGKSFSSKNCVKLDMLVPSPPTDRNTTSRLSLSSATDRGEGLATPKNENSTKCMYPDNLEEFTHKPVTFKNLKSSFAPSGHMNEYAERTIEPPQGKYPNTLMLSSSKQPRNTLLHRGVKVNEERQNCVLSSPSNMRTNLDIFSPKVNNSTIVNDHKSNYGKSLHISSPYQVPPTTSCTNNTNIRHTSSPNGLKYRVSFAKSASVGKLRNSSEDELKMKYIVPSSKDFQNWPPSLLQTKLRAKPKERSRSAAGFSQNSFTQQTPMFARHSEDVSSTIMKMKIAQERTALGNVQPNNKQLQLLENRKRNLPQFRISSNPLIQQRVNNRNQNQARETAEQIIMRRSVEKVQRWIKNLPLHFQTIHHVLPPTTQDY